MEINKGPVFGGFISTNINSSHKMCLFKEVILVIFMVVLRVLRVMSSWQWN